MHHPLFDETRRFLKGIMGGASGPSSAPPFLFPALPWPLSQRERNGGKDYSSSPGAKPRRMVFSVEQRGSTKWSR